MSANIRYEQSYLEHSFGLSRQTEKVVTACHYEVELTISHGELGRVHRAQVPVDVKTMAELLDIAFRDLMKHDLRNNKVVYTNWYTRENVNTVNIPAFL